MEGLEVEGWEVEGLAVEGLAVEGLAMEGLAVKGLAVEGSAEVGLVVVERSAEAMERDLRVVRSLIVSSDESFGRAHMLGQFFFLFFIIIIIIIVVVASHCLTREIGAVDLSVELIAVVAKDAEYF